MKWLMLLIAGAFAQNMTPRCTFLPRELSGSWTGTTAGASGGFGGTCGGVSYNPLTSENLLILNVPASAPPGGMLTLDTCNGTSWDTEIIVSTPLPGGRCPTNSSAFTCAVANDDACGVQSRVSIPAIPGSSYGILVTGFGSSSGPYTLTWNYGSQTSPSSSRTHIGSRSGTASMMMTPSNSFTSQPSYSSTPSVSVGPSWSSSSSGIGSSTPSMTPASSMTSSETSSPDPSFSSSFTMRASQSSSPSMLESPSMSDTRTETSSPSSTKSTSFSMTAYPTRTVLAPLAAPNADTSNSSPLVYGISGLSVGIVITMMLFGMYYVSLKRIKARRSVHLSPQIFFNNTPSTSENVTETKNSSFRTIPISKKTEFDPSSVF